MRAALQISLLALVLGAGSTAHAQDTSSEPTPAQVRVAAEAFDRGREAYKSEEYVEAAEQFEKADSNAPSSAALELAIRARDKAGDLGRAATLMALALKRYPDDENLLKLSADLLKRASAKLFELTASCDQACELTLGGKLVHGAPDTERVIYMSPGPQTIRAGWSDNRSDSKQVEAEAGGKGEVMFNAPPTPAAQSMAQEPAEPAPVAVAPANPEKDDGGKKGGGWSPTVFYVGAGLTAVLGGVTVWSGIDTLNNPGKDKVKAACDAHASNCDALYEEGRSHQTRTNVLIGATAAVGAASILVAVLATDWGGGKQSSEGQAALIRRPRVAVTPWASLDGGGLQAIGRF